MLTALAVLGGFGLDLLLADPAWMPHPVVGMGRAIAALEKRLRRLFPATPAGERAAGRVLAAALPLGTFALAAGALALAYRLHPAAGFALETLWCWQALALRGLADESGKVYAQLAKGDLPAARRAVSRIVGRDTGSLTAAGVTKAAVETVAENFSDGVAAPLFYLLLGGAPLGLAYKAVNTMDSMVGYKNKTYLHFGRAAARLDDAANFLPSRLAALLWIGAAGLAGFDGRGAWRIWRRDRLRHASPNSAQTESACAGALGVQLAGPAWYFGEYYDKPTIGDDTRPVEPADILRADRMLYLAGFLALGLGLGLRFGLAALLRWL
ncbi:MAG TPA: adenosylcobinamide-phosphate synthase CbiB [Candidatus Faecalibacterium gallistercoris]|uniref:Cobalamin biosynthesis protein CobD n=1 Tax=Candidatus Faecalibacterium gallistercoris TaxID=2838579 RepID=A0A9D2JMI3_9FIRM|nr:adenosylcobinamide-phosphate synthase CbiB [Candidatus Faecalibacterium gallistercoris]